MCIRDSAIPAPVRLHSGSPRAAGLVVGEDDDTEEDIGVAGEVLRRGVDHLSLIHI